MLLFKLAINRRRVIMLQFLLAPQIVEVAVLHFLVLTGLRLVAQLCPGGAGDCWACGSIDSCDYQIINFSSMERIKKYKTNPLLASVIALTLIAGVFSIDIEKLLRFYTDPGLTVLIFIAILILLTLFFGFEVQLFKDQVVYRRNLFFKKGFKIEELSHVLFQPTWRGVMSLNTRTNIRSLHIVRRTGGWLDTISLANGAFREEDLADIARRLQQMNPRIEIDEYTKMLIKKYS